ncbi:hypothetical protein B484DRAFT_433392, partial [Ochromonadaceae sp. CCMP2298]
MTALVAVCCGGLEQYVREDLAKKVPDDVTIEQFTQSTDTSNAIKLGTQSRYIHKGDGGCGKLILRNVQDVTFIHSVRSVQCWLVHLASSCTLPSGAEGIQHVQQLTLGVNFESALESWVCCLNDEWREKMSDLVAKKRRPTFCVRCIRDGQHEYNSVELARKIGESVLEKTDWTVSLAKMDIEIVALVLSETLLLSMHVPSSSSRFLKSRLPGEARLPVVSTGLTSGLRASTAYNLVCMGRPSIGDVMVDAMAGCGAGFVEAAYSHGCIAIGGDVDRELQTT